MAGNFQSAGIVKLYVQYIGRTFNDQHKFSGPVKVQPADNAETIAQRRSQASYLCRRPDESKRRQVDAQGSGTRSFTDNDIQGIVFHGCIEHFLNAVRQAVYFIDKKNIPFLEIR